MGKSHEQQAQYNEQAQAAYSATQQPQYQQPQYAPPPQQYAAAPPAAGGTGDLDRLVELHNSGALDDQEFAAAKAKLLGI